MASVSNGRDTLATAGGESVPPAVGEVRTGDSELLRVAPRVRLGSGVVPVSSGEDSHAPGVRRGVGGDAPSSSSNRSTR